MSRAAGVAAADGMAAPDNAARAPRTHRAEDAADRTPVGPAGPAREPGSATSPRTSFTMRYGDRSRSPAAPGDRPVPSATTGPRVRHGRSARFRGPLRRSGEPVRPRCGFAGRPRGRGP
ncbi:hypothetical protein GCM10017687_10050 [Streptomyces echinatus]